MNFNVNAGVVGASSATEGAIVTSMAATTSAASTAIIGVAPMGADLDSVQFAAALNAAGATYVGTASEHCVDRSMFAEAQGVAAATYTATDVINNAALAL